MKNRSILFGISDAEFTCGVEQMYLRDARGDRLSVPDLAFANGNYSIHPMETINYPCDASKFVKITTNVVSSLIDKMCIWITTDYRVLGLWRRHFNSVMFQWPAATGVNQWLEGPVYHEGNPVRYSASDYASPLKIVDCSSAPPEVYKRFRSGHLEIIRNGRVVETR